MSEAPGYRNVTPAHSEIYKKRANELKDTLREAAEANAEEARHVNTTTREEIKNMNAASRNAKGYIALIQAGTQEANYLNAELLRLRADTLRQTDIQVSAFVEEAQDDFDETSAFEGAVATWKDQASGPGY
jgi:hypothetical protein